MESATVTDASKWRFQAMLLTSGQSAIETASTNDLLAAIANDDALAGSYRIVKRQEIEESVRVIKLEELRAEHEARKKAAEEEAAANADGVNGETAPTTTEDELVLGEVDMNPSVMASGFQRLVVLDKLAFTADGGTPGGSTTTGVDRMYLLTDYPSTVAEVHALLITGEAAATKPHSAAPGIPLFPLVDGVLVVADPMRELRERRKSISRADERRNRIPRRVSVELKNTELLERQVPLAGSSLFQTANPLVRDLYSVANVGGLEWSDFVFVDVPCTISANEVKPTPDLVHDLMRSTAPLLSQKAAFKEWVSTVTTIALPSFDKDSESAGHMKHRYDSVIDSVYEPSVGVAVVLIAMREAVALDASEDVSPHATAPSNNTLLPGVFVHHWDTAALRLAHSYELLLRDTRASSVTCSVCEVGGERIDSQEKRLWRSCDFPGVENQGRKGLPTRPLLTSAERSVLDTELTPFTDVPIPRVHLTSQLLRFEELLGQSWKGKLRVRYFSEELGHDILPQRLAGLLSDNPTVIKDYYPPTDELLVAIMNTTAPGRFKTTSWSARDHVRHRPALKDWQRELPLPEEYLTPRTALAATGCVPLSSGELGAVSEKCSIAYPADQSIVRLWQTSHAPSWLSVSLNCETFGLRPTTHPPKLFASHLYASLRDGSHLSIHEGLQQPGKPDGHASVTVDYTSIDHLQVTAGSDGTIIQRRLQVTTSIADQRPHELYRVICGKGIVVCVMSDESRRTLFPNGEVIVRSSSQSHSVDDEGVQRQLVVDPETNALVESHLQTGVIVVTHTDGSRVTYHTDGTCMYSTATRSHVLISKHGLADVCIDVDVNLTARRHARGEKVAVTKGGLRARSIVRAPDGTQIHLQYNTKVVAEVNGRIVVQKSDGTRVVAKDSGRVEFTPQREDLPAVVESTDDADRDELDYNSVYYFNCRDGSFSYCDHEQNQFRAELGDGRGVASIVVDLAGVLSERVTQKYEVDPIPAKAVINEPIEPYLFILRGDGTGREVLRSRDAQHYLTHARAMGAEVGVDTSYTASWASTTEWMRSRTFVTKFKTAVPNGEQPYRWFQDDLITATFAKLQFPVATAFCSLPHQCLPAESIPLSEYSSVRRIDEHRPMDTETIEGMLRAVKAWQEWQVAREQNMNRFKVEDPRPPEILAQEAAMQRKVVAAYKATRAKKKAEQQRLREQQRKLKAVAENTSAPMETVQEGDEPQNAEEEDNDIDQLFSDDSGEHSQSDMDIDVDDPDELMWTAFAAADRNGVGRLSLQEVRYALVQVLGVGVSTEDLVHQLWVAKQPEPCSIPFDAFTDLVDAFRRQTSSNQVSPRGIATAMPPLPLQQPTCQWST